MHALSPVAVVGMVVGILLSTALGALATWGAIHPDRYAAKTQRLDRRMWGSLLETATYPPVLFRIVAIMQAVLAYGTATAVAVELIRDLVSSP